MGEQRYCDWQLDFASTTDDDGNSASVDLPSQPASGRGRGVLASTLRSSPEQRAQAPFGVVSDNRNSTSLSCMQPTPPPCEALVRNCLAYPAPQRTSPPSPGASSDSSSDDCAELRRLCQSQEDLTISTSSVNGFQLPLYNPSFPPPPIPEHSTWVVTPNRWSEKAPTPAKRATDEQSPSVKRSRSNPGTGGLQTSSLPTSKDGLQWRGPSTYSMHCTQKDEETDADSISPTMFCYQQEDTSEVVFRPVFYSPQPSPPATRPVRSRRHSFWMPPAHAAPLSEAAQTTTSGIVPVSSAPQKSWPYSLTSKVGLVDSHCHLDFIFSKVGHYGTYAKFRLEHAATFPDCYEGCVANFCNPLTFKQYNMWSKLLSEDGVWGTFGCHPHYVRDYNNEVEEYMVRALDHPSVVALGEIGLDYSHKNQCDRKLQQDIFRRQLQLAMNRSLPLVIHSRDSTPDTIKILKEMVPPSHPIHRHCFTGDWPEAQEWINTFPNLCLGLTPLVGFERVSPLTEVARHIPLDRLLLETDAPYFLPKQESRNLRTSHPGMVIHVAMRLSFLRNVSVDVILAAARENTRRIYGI
ncbi:uncharacterized protein LOC144098934 [Amblyomma americanum]